MIVTRAKWPHTMQDVIKNLNGTWGVVGADGTNGNLFRLERSLHEPLVYTLTEYRQADEKDVVRREEYAQQDRDKVLEQFAKAIGLA